MVNDAPGEKEAPGSSSRARGLRRNGGASRLRSFRLPGRVAERLERHSASTGKSQNSLAQRYIDEGLRRDAHHFIDFRQGISGGAAIISGTRIKVSHVIRAYQASRASIEDLASELELPVVRVQACLSYYAEFPDDIDRQILDEDEYAAGAHEAWLREQDVTKGRRGLKGKKKAS